MLLSIAVYQHLERLTVFCSKHTLSAVGALVKKKNNPKKPVALWIAFL